MSEDFNVAANILTGLATEGLVGGAKKAAEAALKALSPNGPEEIYLHSIEVALKARRPMLKQYASPPSEEGIRIRRDEVAKALHQNLRVFTSNTPFSSLLKYDFIVQLAEELVNRSALEVPGNNWSRDDATQQVRGLLFHATALFRATTHKNDEMFRQVAISEILSLTDLSGKLKDSLDVLAEEQLQRLRHIEENQQRLEAKFDLFLSSHDVLRHCFFPIDEELERDASRELTSGKEPIWIKSRTWEHFETNQVMLRPEILEILERVELSPCTLVLGGPAYGVTTTARHCGYMLAQNDRGYNVYFRVPSKLEAKDIKGLIDIYGNQRICLIFDDVQDNLELYTEIAEYTSRIAKPLLLRIVLFGHFYSEKAIPLNSSNLVEEIPPITLASPAALIDRLLDHYRMMKQLPIYAEDVAAIRAEFGRNMYYLFIALALWGEQGQKEPFATWNRERVRKEFYHRYLDERLRHFTSIERDLFWEIVAIRQYDLAIPVSWINRAVYKRTPPLSEETLQKLERAGLIWQWTYPTTNGKGVTFYRAGAPGYCQMLLTAASEQNDLEFSTTEFTKRAFRTFIEQGPTNTSLEVMFRKFFLRSGKGIAEYLLGHPTTSRHIVGHLRRTNQPKRVFSTLKTMSLISPYHVREIASSLGLEYLIEVLSKCRSLQVMNLALQTIIDLDRNLATSVTDRLHKQDLLKTLFAESHDYTILGYFLLTISRVDRNIASEFVTDLIQRIYTYNADKERLLITYFRDMDCTLQEFSSLLYGLKRASHPEARKLYRAIPDAQFHRRLQEDVFSGNTLRILDNLDRIDSRRTHRLVENLKLERLILIDSEREPIPRILASLIGVRKLHPQLAARALDAAPIEHLISFVKREMWDGRPSRAIQMIRILNARKARDVLDNIQLSDMEMWISSEELASNVGRFLGELHLTRPTKAVALLSRFSVEELARKLPFTRNPFSSRSSLVDHVASVDRNKGLALYTHWEVEFQRLIRSDRTTIEDIGIGLQQLAHSFPDESGELIHRNWNALVQRSNGNPRLEHIISYLVGLRDACVMQPNLAQRIVEHRNSFNWYVGLAHQYPSLVWIGRYLHVLADIAPEVGIAITRQENLWRKILNESSYQPLGQIAELFNGLAKLVSIPQLGIEDEATLSHTEMLLTNELLQEIAKRVTNEEHTPVLSMLFTSLALTLSKHEEFLLMLVNAINDPSMLAEKIGNERELWPVISYIESLNALSSSLVHNVIHTSDINDWANLVNREWHIWRITRLLRVLATVDEEWLKLLFSNRLINRSHLIQRLFWSRFLGAQADFLMYCQKIEPTVALDLATRFLDYCRDHNRSRIVLKRLISAPQKEIAALLIALNECDPAYAYEFYEAFLEPYRASFAAELKEEHIAEDLLLVLAITIVDPNSPIRDEMWNEILSATSNRILSRAELGLVLWSLEECGPALSASPNLLLQHRDDSLIDELEKLQDPLELSLSVGGWVSLFNHEQKVVAATHLKRMASNTTVLWEQAWLEAAYRRLGLDERNLFETLTDLAIWSPDGVWWLYENWFSLQPEPTAREEHVIL